MKSPFGELVRSADHKYSLNGRALMGVSSVLNVISPFDYGNEVAMLRGTAVHMATEYYDKGTLDPESLDPALVGYLAAWKKFRNETGFAPDPSEIEVMVADYVLGVAGTYDRFGKMGGRSVLLDIKTGSKHWRYDIQVVAYDFLRQRWFAVPEADAVGTVYLHEDGGYAFETVSTRSSCLSLFVAGATILQARISYGG